MNPETTEKLLAKIMVLNDHVWENRVPQPKIEEWLSNFTGKVASVDVERAHALFWLSQFMYFGGREIRVLIRALYRDLYLRPVIQEVKSRTGPDVSTADLGLEVIAELNRTRFFGVGNPSESGVHLLYYFRQENQLQKEHFMDAVQIFSRDGVGNRQLAKPDVKRYVFLDDICGSGDTAIDYSRELVGDMKASDNSIIASYYCLFATAEGMQRIRTESLFGSNCGAVYELDASYRCLSPGNRHFAGHEYVDIDEATAQAMVTTYGALIDPRYANGWKDSQMLLGFHHNTPDNTIGVMWCDGSRGSSNIPWSPIFKRYPKFT